MDTKKIVNLISNFKLFNLSNAGTLMFNKYYRGSPAAQNFLSSKIKTHNQKEIGYYVKALDLLNKSFNEKLVFAQYIKDFTPEEIPYFIEAFNNLNNEDGRDNGWPSTEEYVYSSYFNYIDSVALYEEKNAVEIENFNTALSFLDSANFSDQEKQHFLNAIDVIFRLNSRTATNLLIKAIDKNPELFRHFENNQNYLNSCAFSYDDYAKVFPLAPGFFADKLSSAIHSDCKRGEEGFKEVNPLLNAAMNYAFEHDRDYFKKISEKAQETWYSPQLPEFLNKFFFQYNLTSDEKAEAAALKGDNFVPKRIGGFFDGDYDGDYNREPIRKFNKFLEDLTIEKVNFCVSLIEEFIEPIKNPKYRFNTNENTKTFISYMSFCLAQDAAKNNSIAEFSFFNNGSIAIKSSILPPEQVAFLTCLPLIYKSNYGERDEQKDYLYHHILNNVDLESLKFIKEELIKETLKYPGKYNFKESDFFMIEIMQEKQKLNIALIQDFSHSMKPGEKVSVSKI